MIKSPKPLYITTQRVTLDGKPHDYNRTHESTADLAKGVKGLVGVTHLRILRQPLEGEVEEVRAIVGPDVAISVEVQTGEGPAPVLIGPRLPHMATVYALVGDDWYMVAQSLGDSKGARGREIAGDLLDLYLDGETTLTGCVMEIPRAGLGLETWNGWTWAWTLEPARVVGRKRVRVSAFIDAGEGFLDDDVWATLKAVGIPVLSEDGSSS